MTNHRRKELSKVSGLTTVRALRAVAVVVSLMLLSCACLSADIRYHVAVSGDDSNPGTRAEPFATIHRAQAAIRDHKESRKLHEPVEVLVHAGTYRLQEPLTFTPADSGTADAPITYRAAEDGEVILSGGIPIAGWEKHGTLWHARIDEVERGNLYFHQLFVNGRRARLATSPNKFYLRTAGPIRSLGNRQKARRDPSTKRGFRFRDGDFARWENLDDVQIKLYRSWTSSLHWIKELDLEKGIVRFSNTCSWPVGWWETFERYRIRNYFEALDSPGEWYLDRDKGTLYYWPRPDENMRKANVVAPRLTDLLTVEGNPDEGQFVSHLHFKGLSFQHEDWDFARDSTVDGQAHAKQQNAAITAFGLRDSSFENCEIAHVGAHALRLDEGCQGNRIVHCHIHDCGGGGIYIGPHAEVCYMPPNDRVKVQENVVENNFIHHTSYVLGGSIGIWVGSSSFNEIRHNEISDFDYTGISVGWCWGRKTNIFQRGNIIEYNHVHHNVGDILSDNGAIYVLGYSPGSVIRCNVVHDIRHYPCINWSRGIYLDGNTSSYTVEQNLAYDIMGNGINVKGQHNRVRHNIFAFCERSGVRRGFKARARDFEYDRNTITNNIIVQSEGLMITGYCHPSRYATIDRNLYWPVGDHEALFDDWSGRILDDVPNTGEVAFQEWQKIGVDGHSLVADPQFRDLEGRDFRLKPDSPARKIDFKSFDHTKAGLYGEPDWTGLPDKVEREPHEFAPPPPRPDLDYDFEEYEAGEQPVVGGRLMEDENCRVRVTDRAAAKGQKSLMFVDGPAERRWYPHWVIKFAESSKSGKVTWSCDIMNDRDMPARFDAEFRDWSGSDWHRGPMLRFMPDGRVISDEKTVARLAPGQWGHFEIEFEFGPGAPNSYSLRLTKSDGETRTLEDLPFWDDDFDICTWFGFSSLDDSKAAYYVDNLKIQVEDAARRE